MEGKEASKAAGKTCCCIVCFGLLLADPFVLPRQLQSRAKGQASSPALPPRSA